MLHLHAPATSFPWLSLARIHPLSLSQVVQKSDLLTQVPHCLSHFRHSSIRVSLPVREIRKRSDGQLHLPLTGRALKLPFGGQVRHVASSEQVPQLLLHFTHVYTAEMILPALSFFVIVLAYVRS